MLVFLVVGGVYCRCRCWWLVIGDWWLDGWNRNKWKWKWKWKRKDVKKKISFWIFQILRFKIIFWWIEILEWDPILNCFGQCFDLIDCPSVKRNQIVIITISIHYGTISNTVIMLSIHLSNNPSIHRSFLQWSLTEINGIPRRPSSNPRSYRSPEEHGTSHSTCSTSIQYIHLLH